MTAEPNQHQSPDAGGQPLQRILMWEGYETLIRDGSKRQTVRYQDPFVPGPAEIVLEKDSGEDVVISAEVTGVRTVRRDELSEQDAVRDGFESLAQLQAALYRHYPDMPGGSAVDIVAFELVRP
ncbi:ASCH domain-containing protein [Kocuria palustris]|uniref:ASCH domain-containing protein n=1 Tax=Kocuria palustris TaxID=71999 RepID=UPI003BF8C9E1